MAALDPIKMKAQTRASKLGLTRCALEPRGKGVGKIIVAEAKPGMVFKLKDASGEHFMPRLRCLSWARMLEMLEAAEVVKEQK